MNAKPYTFDRVVRILIGLAIIIGLFLLVKSLTAVLLPFLIAWLMAYLLNPIVLFFQKTLKFKSRILSIFTTLLLFVVLIGGVLWLLIPLVSDEIQKLSEIIVLYSKDINLGGFLPLSWQKEIQDFIWNTDLQSILKNDTLIDAFKNLAPQLWNFINNSLNFVFGLTVIIIIFLYLIFILLDYEKISSEWINLIPVKYRQLISGILNDLKDGMNRYFRGQSLVAIIVGVLFSIGFSFIQLPLAVVLGLFIGMLNMVPYLQIVGVIPALALALLRSAESGIGFGTVLLEIAIVFVVVQLIQDLLLTPRIMGKVTGLNPAVILLSLSIWGSLLGIIGLIIALPLTTLIISYYKRFVLNASDEDKATKEPEQIKNQDLQ